MRKLVYVASPLSESTDEYLHLAQQACLNVMARGGTPFAPNLLYPQMLDDNDPHQHDLAVEMSRQMLGLCNELWLCGEWITPEMEQERKLAEELNIPVREIGTQEILYLPPDELWAQDGQETSPGPSMEGPC